MKVYEIMQDATDSSDEIQLSVAKLLGLDPNFVTVRRRGPNGSVFFKNGGIEVRIWLPRLYDYNSLHLFASLFKKVLRHVLPEYSEFMTERPAFYDSTGAGTWIFDRTPGEWEEKLEKRLAKRRAGTSCALEYTIRKPLS